MRLVAASARKSGRTPRSATRAAAHSHPEVHRPVDEPELPATLLRHDQVGDRRARGGAEGVAEECRGKHQRGEEGGGVREGQAAYRGGTGEERQHHRCPPPQAISQGAAERIGKQGADAVQRKHTPALAGVKPRSRTRNRPSKATTNVAARFTSIPVHSAQKARGRRGGDGGAARVTSSAYHWRPL
ncbi:MAG TPA: hypothetical protein VMK12_20565 [Anaeromyxobacteraceae bacterium]|nr:hypothetical protein [Anaeromyxobacteraceae bacterium]